MRRNSRICMVTEAWGSWIPQCRVREGNGRLGAGLQKVSGPLTIPLSFVTFAWGSEIWNLFLFSNHRFVSILLRILPNPKYCPEAVRLSQCLRSLWPQEGESVSVLQQPPAQLYDRNTPSVGKASQEPPHPHDQHAISSRHGVWFILPLGDSQHSHSRSLVYQRAVIPNSTPGRAETAW